MQNIANRRAIRASYAIELYPLPCTGPTSNFTRSANNDEEDIVPATRRMSGVMRRGVECETVVG